MLATRTAALALAAAALFAGGRYAYTFKGDTLRLRRSGSSDWFTMTRETTTVPPFCGGPGETRPRGGCPVGYSCNCPNGAYCFVAGTCSPDATTGVKCGTTT